MVMITPAFFASMRRAARCAVRKCDTRVGCDGQREFLDVELDERNADDLSIREADGVERDVDAAGLVDHRAQMLVDRPFVERVDLRCVGGTARGDDFPGNRFDRRAEPPGEKQPGSLARNARATAPPIAPPAP